jgi:hypothetical protein
MLFLSQLDLAEVYIMATVTITFTDTDTQSHFSSDLVLAKPEIGMVAGGGSAVPEHAQFTEFMKNFRKMNPGFEGALGSNVFSVFDKVKEDHDVLVLTGNMGTASMNQFLDFLKKTPHIKKLVLEDLTIPAAMLDKFAVALKENASIMEIMINDTAKTSKGSIIASTRIVIDGATTTFSQFAATTVAANKSANLRIAMLKFGDFQPEQFDVLVSAAKDQVLRLGENDVKGKTILETVKTFEEKPMPETATRLYNALNIKRPTFTLFSSPDVGDLNKAIDPSEGIAQALIAVKSALENAKAATASSERAMKNNQ